jgi:hypothetical protein
MMRGQSASGFFGADFGFVNGFDEMPDLLQNAQKLINFYVQPDPDPRAKEQLALLGCPGLNPVAQGAVGQVRGCWVLPGSQQALVAISNMLYLMSITVPATQTSSPQYSLTQVGVLNTNSGPVVMRDNGVLTLGLGGYVLIVDGTFGYYYLISGVPYVNSFAGSLSINSPTITFPGSLPNGLLVASTPTLSDTGGVIPAGTKVASVDTIGLTLTMSANAIGNSFTDTVTLTIPVFGQITDPGFPANPQRLWFIEGWLAVNQGGTRSFQTSGPAPYSMIFPGLFNGLKDSSTDNLITMMENNREAWLIGERTSEVWFNSGGTNFSFSRIPGVGPQIGCAALHSIARAGPQLCWLGRNEQGQNIVVVTSQYSWVKISTPAIDYAIAQYPVISDAVGYAYEEGGELFYVLTFPTADVTWVFDFTAAAINPAIAWHQRASYDPNTGLFHRHRSNCFMDFGDVRIVGDYQTGQLHQMSRSFYTDAGAPIRRVRRTPHQWLKATRERMFFSQLQVEFTPGVGLQVGQGVNPQVMLRYSNDGGFTWSNEYWVTIGQAGNTKNRAIWRKLGQARDRVWEINFTDPVQADIIGATCYAQAS